MNMRAIFFDFRGTLCREGYFGAMLAAIGALAAVMLTAIIVSFAVENTLINDFTNRMLFVACIAFLWSNMAITAKRLHDLGVSGWLQAPAWIVTALPLMFTSKPLAAVSWTISIAIFVALAAIPTKSEA